MNRRLLTKQKFKKFHSYFISYSLLQGREQPRLLPQDDGREAAGEVDGARVALREDLHLPVRRLVLRHSGESMHRMRGRLLQDDNSTW